MPTVKLVVIGASGVGKTSIRTQYISGRFSTGYRATIGADFIAKTLPHPSKPDEVVTLQIWDTAGQERFSSLSTAFFRGADAALLMFDVNQPETLTTLTTWWHDFCTRAPLYDEDRADFCCVVVGNKTDLVPPGASAAVSEAEARRVLDALVPPSSPPTSPLDPVPITIVPEEPAEGDPALPLSTRAIDIDHYLRSHARHRSWGTHPGTRTSTHTGVTAYHTPSSSLFDGYASARSSPSLASRLSSPVRTTRRASSSSSASSAPTITPSLFLRSQDAAVVDTPTTSSSHTRDAPLDRGPKLFFTSAKTGEGVDEVFEYIARRVVARWAYEDATEAGTLRVQDPSETIRFGLMTREDATRRLTGSCC